MDPTKVANEPSKLAINERQSDSAMKTHKAEHSSPDGDLESQENETPNCRIRSRVAMCLEKLKNLQSTGALKARENEVPSFAWHDELGRLQVWIDTNGAHQKKDRSLDYRLRNALHFRSQVIRQLDRLHRILEDLESVLGGSFHKETDINDTEDEEPLNGLRPIYTHLAHCIDGLNQMSILIRHPAPIDKPVFQDGGRLRVSGHSSRKTKPVDLPKAMTNLVTTDTRNPCPESSNSLQRETPRLKYCEYTTRCLETLHILIKVSIQTERPRLLRLRHSMVSIPNIQTQDVSD